jgi:hypothetical protein
MSRSYSFIASDPVATSSTSHPTVGVMANGHNRTFAAIVAIPRKGALTPRQKSLLLDACRTCAAPVAMGVLFVASSRP